jgi:hypothetical protein
MNNFRRDIGRMLTEANEMATAVQKDPSLVRRPGI